MFFRFNSFIHRLGFQGHVFGLSAKCSQIRFYATPFSIILGFAYLKTPILNDRNLLIPDPRGDTFEMGLFLSSTKQLDEELRKKREIAINTSIFPRSIKRVILNMKQYVVEPVFTILRFIELSFIFFPLLILYPITFFGSHRATMSKGIKLKETNGSFIWFRLLRKALEWAGPTFIKLGQWAASRTDIFSEGLCYELGHLHSNAKPHKIAYTKHVIEDSLGGKYKFNDIFEEFYENPVGCGAIAQVYVGKLSEKFMAQENIQRKNRFYAVKVVHPNIVEKISRDLKIMKFFANVIDSIPSMEWLSLPNEVDQFSVLMNLQLDLRIECQNLEKFNKNFKTNPRIKFPEGLGILTTRSVLFEEYIHGFPMESFVAIKSELDSTSLCRKVSDPFIEAFLQMLILDDFIHADLHPGNVMIRFVKLNKNETEVVSSESELFQTVQRLKHLKDNNSSSFVNEIKKVLSEYDVQICLLDTGLVTELNDRNRVNFIALFNALARFDGYHAGELMIERSRTPETAVDKELFAMKVEKLVDTVKKHTFTLGTVSIGELLDKMLSMVRQHHVRMEGDFVSVIVAILLLEGIGRQLDPDMDLFARFVLFAFVNGFDNAQGY